MVHPRQREAVKYKPKEPPLSAFALNHGKSWFKTTLIGTLTIMIKLCGTKKFDHQDDKKQQLP